MGQFGHEFARQRELVGAWQFTLTLRIDEAIAATRSGIAWASASTNRPLMQNPTAPTLPPRAAASAVAAPESLLEKRIAAIWQEALGVDTVSATDNFFDIGGHSLLATQAISRVRATFGVDLLLRSLFEAPTPLMKPVLENLERRSLTVIVMA